jgi:Protein of unknown function (DUF5132)
MEERLMQKAKHESNGGFDKAAPAAEHVELPQAEPDELLGEDADDGQMVATVATVAVVGVAAVAFEAALLPGIVLGVAAVAVPRYLPKIGTALNPLFRSTVRGAYKLGQKTKEMVAEAQEQVHDIVAEVHAENDPVTAAKGAAASGSAA